MVRANHCGVLVPGAGELRIRFHRDAATTIFCEPLQAGGRNTEDTGGEDEGIVESYVEKGCLEHIENYYLSMWISTKFKNFIIIG